MLIFIVKIDTSANLLGLALLAVRERTWVTRDSASSKGTFDSLLTGSIWLLVIPSILFTWNFRMWPDLEIGSV